MPACLCASKVRERERERWRERERERWREREIEGKSDGREKRVMWVKEIIERTTDGSVEIRERETEGGKDGEKISR